MHRVDRVILMVIATALVGAPPSAGAQVRAARALATAPVEFAEPFSAVSSLVELANGRVLVHDSREKRFGTADFASGTFSEVAREGAGPLEYRNVASLLRMPGDSIVVWDMANSRRLTLAPDGKPVGTAPTAPAGQPMMNVGQPIPRATDASGRWYASFQGLSVVGREVQPGDSLAVVRITPETGRRDTLIAFLVPRGEPTRRDGGTLRVRAAGFVTRNAWGVFPDGRVLVVHGADYVPEVFRADGTRSKASAVPHTRIPVTAKDRDGHIKEIASRMNQMGAMMRTEAAGATTMEVLPPDPWQEYHPPLLSDRIHVDSRGRAWVRVMDPDAESGERYDLLDAEGRLVDAVRMPRGVKFVGMGNDVLYGTREDEDGLVYLRRYPLP